MASVFVTPAQVTAAKELIARHKAMGFDTPIEVKLIAGAQSIPGDIATRVEELEAALQRSITQIVRYELKTQAALRGHRKVEPKADDKALNLGLYCEECLEDWPCTTYSELSKDVDDDSQWEPTAKGAPMA